MAAYVIARYNFPGKNLVYILFTITLLVPGQAKAQPIFSLVNTLDLYDSIYGLSIVYISFGLAMSIFILRSSFMSIPKSFDEAAILEGASFFYIYRKIDLPLAKNGVLTAGMIMFLNNWNEYFYASLLTSSDENRTLPLALQFFTESFSYDYTKLFAALTLVIVPGVVLYLIAQKQFRAGLAAGGVKG